jgi:hypothetical protein
MNVKLPLRVLFVVAVVFLFLHPTQSRAATSVAVTSNGCACYKSDVCIGVNAQYCLGRTVCFANCQAAGGSTFECNYCCPLSGGGCGVCGLDHDGDRCGCSGLDVACACDMIPCEQ